MPRCKFKDCTAEGEELNPGIILCVEHHQALIWEAGELIWPTVDEIAKLFVEQAVRIAMTIKRSDDGLKALNLLSRAHRNMKALADEVEKQSPLAHKTRTTEAFRR